ncbi:MAG: hypothetical protein ACI9HK_004002 [Pirellulaceae bacterium]|jgi:hypothetical protein
MFFGSGFWQFIGRGVVKKFCCRPILYGIGFFGERSGSFFCCRRRDFGHVDQRVLRVKLFENGKSEFARFFLIGGTDGDSIRDDRLLNSMNVDDANSRVAGVRVFCQFHNDDKVESLVLAALEYLLLSARSDEG